MYFLGRPRFCTSFGYRNTLVFGIFWRVSGGNDLLSDVGESGETAFCSLCREDGFRFDFTPLPLGRPLGFPNPSIGASAAP